MRDLDYFEIVVACLRYKNTKHHLEDYFIREFKKAKRADYEADEFFDGCMRAIETLLNLEKPELDDRKLYVKKPITLTEIKKDYLLTDTSRHHSSVIKRYGIEFDRDTALRPIRYKNYFQLIEPLKQAYDIIKTNSPQELNAPESGSKEISLREKIEEAFGFMLHVDPRKHKIILEEDDFNKLINWILYYFENDFKLPKIDKPIQKVNTNKGNVIYTFLKFYKDQHPTKTRPYSLYNFIKACFYEYRDDNIENYKKQKMPQFYQDLIKKNR